MEKLIAQNKKAFHDYFVEDTYEAGIVLVGCEVKSIRLGAINLRDSFVIIKNGEVYMIGAHISPYKILAAIASFCSIAARSTSCAERWIRKATRSFRSKSISKTRSSRCKSGFAKARNCTTSVKPSKRRKTTAIFAA